MIAKVGTMMGRNPGTGRVLKIVALSIALVSWVAGCDSVDRSSKDATPFSLDAVSGTTLIVNYWATWCGPCRKAAPSLERLRERFSEKDVLVVGISAEERPVVEVYERNNPANYPIWLDTESAFSKVIGARSLPTFIVVDREGKVQRLLVGLNGLDQLATIVDQLL